MSFRATSIAGVVAVFLGIAFWFLFATDTGTKWFRVGWNKFRGSHSLDARVAEFLPDVEARLRPEFVEAGLSFPPKDVAYLVLKDSRILEVYARNRSEDDWRHVKDYPVLGLSGTSGLKLVEGDKQVPEGIYRAESLNPNSRFHLSIRLDYPNAFDRAKAHDDGREKLGGDIMIHGETASIGCIAIGDQASEDLFILAALVAKENVHIIVNPTDLRTNPAKIESSQLKWIGELYERLENELAAYRT